MKKVVRVVGARPQYMQVPTLKKALEEFGCKHILIHTGQHYSPSMSGNLLSELDNAIPQYNLGVGSGTHGQMTARIVEKLEEILIEVHPDFVIVDGDTNSTLATALVTAKLRIPLVHIEAGLRDFDRNRPEEINRILTDHACELCLAPIPRAMQNLISEGRGDASELVGDFLLDNYLKYYPRADFRIVDRLKIRGPFGFMTLHRPENTDEWALGRFQEIMNFASKSEVPIVFPVHPRTEARVRQFRQDYGDGSILFCEPTGYLETLGALRACQFVLTDSGGLSREAVWSGKPCLMLFRKDTWHDLLEHNWAQIFSEDGPSLMDKFAALSVPPAEEVRRMFGGGNATSNTMDVLKKRGWL